MKQEKNVRMTFNVKTKRVTYGHVCILVSCAVFVQRLYVSK